MEFTKDMAVSQYLKETRRLQSQKVKFAPIGQIVACLIEVAHIQQERIAKLEQATAKAEG